MITYISITVGDMKTELLLLKTNVLKFTQQKLERRNQRNKRFIKPFTNVQYASPRDGRFGPAVLAPAIVAVCRFLIRKIL